MKSAAAVELEGVHCFMAIRRPVPGVIVVEIAGTDIGELARAPFRELERDLQGGRIIELFIDARRTRGASIEVSNEWAQWLVANRDRLGGVTMLTGSRFIHVTAEFVRRFAGLGDQMRITNDASAFDAALEKSVTASRAPPP